jgi:hypothetical protein
MASRYASSLAAASPARSIAMWPGVSVAPSEAAERCTAAVAVVGPPYRQRTGGPLWRLGRPSVPPLRRRAVTTCADRAHSAALDHALSCQRHQLKIFRRFWRATAMSATWRPCPACFPTIGSGDPQCRRDSFRREVPWTSRCRAFATSCTLSCATPGPLQPIRATSCQAPKRERAQSSPNSIKLEPTLLAKPSS